MGKILQFYDGYYEASGGIETHITDLTQKLGHEFEIITDAIPGYPVIEKPDQNSTIKRFKPDNYALTTLRSIRNNKVSFPYRVLTDTMRINNKHKYLRRANYDLVHFHGSGAGGAIVKLSYILRSAQLTDKLTDFSYIKQKILTVHGLSSLLIGDPIVKEQEMKFITQFENIICVDERLHRFLRENLEGKRIWYVPNSVDTRRFKFAPLSSDEKLRVGFIGRLEKSRGISLLYDLIREMPSYIDFCILGAGNSTDIKKFKSNVDTSKIHFETNINYDEVHNFYRKFDVLLNPVLAEGISRVTLEAMSSGRPVIMLNKGNRYPVINGETGYLIEYSIKDLLKLLQFLHKNRDKLEEVGKNARSIVENEYDSRVIIPKIAKIYEEVMQ